MKVRVLNSPCSYIPKFQYLQILEFSSPLVPKFLCIPLATYTSIHLFQFWSSEVHKNNYLYTNIVRSTVKYKSLTWSWNVCSEGRETPLSPPPPSSSSVQTSPRGLGYTCGPIDGSLYAVVHQGAAGGARGSPLTVSMDSGISSAPPQRPSPPEPEPENQAHGDLDKLLHDMMLTVEVS